MFGVSRIVINMIKVKIEIDMNSLNRITCIFKNTQILNNVTYQSYLFLKYFLVQRDLFCPQMAHITGQRSNF